MSAEIERELRAYMRRPQRHRLLHGYPLAAALHSADHLDPHHDVPFGENHDRKLIVGVLPHPFCNPAVTGCGFCTFPHEPGNSAKTTPVVRQVEEEVHATGFRFLPRDRRSNVAAMYFGGGTANMVEPEPFRDLCTSLDAYFTLDDAEVTLEGVPAYFLKGKPRLAEVMRDTLKARHFRLSMGIQTFDEKRLKQMGRSAFGSTQTFREVVEYAHKLGFTVSGDLLFNLPGQSLDEMLADARRAIDIGLDHIGLYHLVMFRGLGTEWSKDDELLDALPDNERACEHWLLLRERMLAAGWVQTSLTNFEPARFRHQPQRYQYEECSFRPDKFEAIGFGPSGTSYTSSPDFRTGIKTMNPTSSDEYVAAVKNGNRVWNRYFSYQLHDQKVFWLTRRLAALDIDRFAYRGLFGTDPLDDFPVRFEVLKQEGLIEVTPDAIRPTPRGMFYSDSVAALIAAEAIRANRLAVRGAKPALLRDVRENSAAFSPMG
jgi:oxygen-independent coproporphyrinogen-3 oxidase